MPLPPDDAAPAGGAPLTPARAAIVAAFVTLYFVWGSTYLAIRIAADTVPPFLLAGARFACAGGALVLWRRYRNGVPYPSPRDWLGAGGIGACLILISNVSVVFAEQTLSSGVVALFAAGTPLLVALLNGRRTRTSLGRMRGAGLALGTIGMVLLGGAAFAAVHSTAPLFLMALASIAWAVGSTYARDWGGPADLPMAAGAQMLVGGVLALVAAGGTGELTTMHAISNASWIAWAYLAVVGSLLAYPIYQWLLSVADATAVASYTYINPVVAVALGVLFAGEAITRRTLVATAVLIPAVILVVTGAAGRPTGDDH